MGFLYFIAHSAAARNTTSTLSFYQVYFLTMPLKQLKNDLQGVTFLTHCTLCLCWFPPCLPYWQEDVYRTSKTSACIAPSVSSFCRTFSSPLVCNSYISCYFAILLSSSTLLMSCLVLSCLVYLMVFIAPLLSSLPLVALGISNKFDFFTETLIMTRKDHGVLQILTASAWSTATYQCVVGTFTYSF